MEKQNEQAKKMGKIISQCWADEAFKQRFKIINIEENYICTFDNLSIQILSI
jgi:hypothetical protein